MDRRNFCQLSSTDDRRQLITLSVHLCVQHDVRDGDAVGGTQGVARGPPAAAETCSY